jgi:hypothetical protein
MPPEKNWRYTISSSIPEYCYVYEYNPYTGEIKQLSKEEQEKKKSERLFNALWTIETYYSRK